ncbi:MAG TPA: iron-sulfur cluster assembly scaffold protein [Steroidobacteraceae bacterium]
MNYSALTRRYFDAAVNAGVLTGADIFRGAAGSRAQGTWVQFDVQVNSGIIRAARFLAFACPHTIAVSAWTAENAVGGPARAALPESVQALSERFAVPAPKLGRLLIVEDAWLATMQAAAAAIAGQHGTL